jgi:hypothetical protein
MTRLIQICRYVTYLMIFAFIFYNLLCNEGSR